MSGRSVWSMTALAILAGAAAWAADGPADRNSSLAPVAPKGETGVAAAGFVTPQNPQPPAATGAPAIAGQHAETVPSLAWQAGVARVNITPEQPLRMAGYGFRNHAAEGKTSDLWAKALALEAGDGSRAVLVTLDLLGLDRTLAQSIGARLEKEFGLRRDQVMLCASHTHSGPVVKFNLRPIHFDQVSAGEQALILAYAARLEEQVAAIVGEALGALAPARLRWGSGQATFAVNRRTNREGEAPQLRAAGLLAGPGDPDVPVLAVRDRSHKLLAVVFGYACHATVLNEYKWCADYPGYAQAELETRHPGAVALFWAGCGADQNPLPRRSVPLAQEYGRQLAGAVETVLAGVMRPLASQLQTRWREIALPMENLPDPARVRQDAESKNAAVAAQARILLREIEAGRPPSPAYPYPVAQWRLGGEIQWVFLGGEVVVDYALRLKAGQGGTRTWVTAYANDVMGYIPSLRVLREGGYEGGGATTAYGLPALWAPAVEQTIVAEVLRPWER